MRAGEQTRGDEAGRRTPGAEQRGPARTSFERASWSAMVSGPTSTNTAAPSRRLHSARRPSNDTIRDPFPSAGHGLVLCTSGARSTSTLSAPTLCHTVSPPSTTAARTSAAATQAKLDTCAARRLGACRVTEVDERYRSWLLSSHARRRSSAGPVWFSATAVTSSQCTSGSLIALPWRSRNRTVPLLARSTSATVSGESATSSGVRSPGRSPATLGWKGGETGLAVSRVKSCRPCVSTRRRCRSLRHMKLGASRSVSTVNGLSTDACFRLYTATCGPAVDTTCASARAGTARAPQRRREAGGGASRQRVGVERVGVRAM